jgi:hypothetical protein
MKKITCWFKFYEHCIVYCNPVQRTGIFASIMFIAPCTFVFTGWKIQDQLEMLLGCWVLGFPYPVILR